MVEPLTLRNMVETITLKRAYSTKYKTQRFGSGTKGAAYTNLLVVNFFGPAGARASAYCCNMNIDLDAEPQAYGPFGDPKITPIEKLSNGGWLDAATNAAMKKAYEDAVKKFDDLGKKKSDLIAKSKPSDDPTKPAPAPPDPKAMADLDKEIEKAKQEMKDAAVFWNDDPAKRPVNFGKIFWQWYGPFPLTRAEARARSFDEKVGEEIVNGKTVPKMVHRKPVLDDKKPYLEDVDGRLTEPSRVRSIESRRARNVSVKVSRERLDFQHRLVHCRAARLWSIIGRRFAMDIRSAMRVAAGIIGASLSLVAPASAQNGPYLSDLPKLYPAAYTLWAQSLPYALGPLPDWLASLKGVVTPIRDVSVGGVSLKFGTTCMPHDCGGNIAGVLFSQQRNRIVALVRLSSKSAGSNVMIVGSMTSAEIACVQRLIDNDQSASC